MEAVCHIERMSDDKSTKKLSSNKPEGLRLVGRPRKHWLDEVEEDFKTDGSERLEKTSPEWRRMAEYSEGGQSSPWTVAPRSQSVSHGGSMDL
jgi:hypothetical protein